MDNDDGLNIEVVDVRELALILRVTKEGTVNLAGRLPKPAMIRALRQIADDFEASP